MHTSPTDRESVYVRQKIKNDIAKYNKKRNLMSPSPKPEMFSENEQTIQYTHESTGLSNVNGFVPPKLPFLNDIHKLKKQETECERFGKGRAALPREK